MVIKDYIKKSRFQEVLNKSYKPRRVSTTMWTLALDHSFKECLFIVEICNKKGEEIVI